jgi:hypothetical protein
MIRKQNLIYMSSVIVETLQDKLTVVDSENDQFLIEWLLQKQVHWVKRCKVVQYLVKWKEYSEKKNTWVKKMNIHEDVIEKYKSVSVLVSWDDDDLDYLLSEIKPQLSAQFYNSLCICLLRSVLTQSVDQQF